jgi:hypothetical protein
VKLEEHTGVAADPLPVLTNVGVEPKSISPIKEAPSGPPKLAPPDQDVPGETWISSWAVVVATGRIANARRKRASRRACFMAFLPSFACR